MSHEATYSKIIGPEEYNRLIGQHLYIAEADQIIAKIVAREVHLGREQVLEIGCGPARILPLLSAIQGIRLTGIDYDEAFVMYARDLLISRDIHMPVELANVLHYQHPRALDVVVSQGFHHHMEKGPHTLLYLQNVHQQLNSGGIYVVGDEFLPDYRDAGQRLARAVVWYSHIISNARQNSHQELAIEEAKTLLDDLAEGIGQTQRKNVYQIEFLLDSVDSIDAAVMQGNLRLAERLAENLLQRLAQAGQREYGPDSSLSLSRGDFKICHRVFQKEVEEVGFEIIGVTTVGPIATIGGMAVYVLRKS